MQLKKANVNNRVFLDITKDGSGYCTLYGKTVEYSEVETHLADLNTVEYCVWWTWKGACEQRF